jgi:hypothetical protein
VLGHIRHAEVVGDESVGEGAEGDDDKDELALGGGARHAHQRGVAACGAEDGQRTLDQCQAQGEDQRKVAEFRDHLAAPEVVTSVFFDSSWACWARCNASAASGGM